MRRRVHAQLDESNISSVQDSNYLVGQLIGMKIMRRFYKKYEMEYGMDMVTYRNQYGSVIIFVSGVGVSITIRANGKREDLEYGKDEQLDAVVENVVQIWKSMLSPEQVA